MSKSVANEKVKKVLYKDFEKLVNKYKELGREHEELRSKYNQMVQKNNQLNEILKAFNDKISSFEKSFASIKEMYAETKTIYKDYSLQKEKKEIKGDIVHFDFFYSGNSNQNSFNELNAKYTLLKEEHNKCLNKLCSTSGSTNINSKSDKKSTLIKNALIDSFIGTVVMTNNGFTATEQIDTDFTCEPVPTFVKFLKNYPDASK